MLPLQPAKRLTILVPYRDRQEHLVTFVPHMRGHFATQPEPPRIVVVEQAPGKPFNRGALKNVGFLLACDSSDYVCFHDIDYLPLSVDYGFTDVPCCLAWYGAESRPIDPARPGKRITHNLERFFGAALLMPNAAFLAANGYSNRYWTWGYEDTDLRRRLRLKGVSIGRRKGAFRPLDHRNEGFNYDRSATAAHQKSRAIFESDWGDNRAPNVDEDGLSTCRFQIVQSHNIDGPPGALPIERITVELLMDP